MGAARTARRRATWRISPAEPMLPRPILLLAAVAAAVASAEGPDEPAISAPPPTDFSELDISLAAAQAAQAAAAGDAKSAAGAPLPPGIESAAACEAMLSEALGWAACSGLLMYTGAADADADADSGGGAARACSTLVPAPFSLLPTEIPASMLDQAYALAPLFNSLAHAVASDLPWLERTLRSTAASDPFTRQLLKLCAKAHGEGAVQRATLAVLRSDYMVQEPADSAGSAPPPPPRLLQIELNTIASSFGGLGAKV